MSHYLAPGAYLPHDALMLLPEEVAGGVLRKRPPAAQRRLGVLTLF